MGVHQQLLKLCAYPPIKAVEFGLTVTACGAGCELGAEGAIHESGDREYDSVDEVSKAYDRGGWQRWLGGRGRDSGHGEGDVSRPPMEVMVDAQNSPVGAVYFLNGFHGCF